MSNIFRIMQMAGSVANGGGIPTTTGSDFNPGVRDNAAPTTHTGTITIPASSAAVFIVHVGRATGASATASFTVDGDACTEIHSVSSSDSITRVYYLANPSSGSVSFTNVDTGAYSVGVAVIGLDTNSTPSVSSTVFTPSNTGSTGLQTILSLSADPDTLIYSIAPSSNYVDEADSTNTPNSLFSPVLQALTGFVNRNMIHCSSDIFTSSETYTVNYDITTTYTYNNSGVYLILSWE